MRNAVTLACTECKQRNYQTNKKQKKVILIELKMKKRIAKFCKKINTLHRETKIRFSFVVV